MTEINKETPMEKMTIGGDIYEAGNAREFKTGDWRSMRPIFDVEKCKQCGLCFPVCPENAIPVGKEDLKRNLVFVQLPKSDQRFIFQNSQ